MKDILIIDGNALAFSKKPDEKSVPANKLYSNVHGRDIFVPRKFIKKLIDFKFYSHFNHHIVVTFDDKVKNTFRHKMDENYKNRPISDKQKEVKEYVYQSIEEIKKYLKILKIPYYSSPNWEADDIIGMLVEKFEKTARTIEVITVDEDLLQLVSKKTKVSISRELKEETYDQQKVFDKFGYKSPKMIIDRKVLIGDKSDNIKNYNYGGKPIRNINTVSKQLLIKYSSVDNIYKNINSVKQPYRSCLIAGKDRVEHNFKLVTIVRDWQLSIPFEHFLTIGLKKKDLMRVIEELNLQELYKKKWFKWGFKRRYHNFPDIENNK